MIIILSSSVLYSIIIVCILQFTLYIRTHVDQLSIVDLRDITTQNDLNDEKAVFAFNIQPTLGLNITFGYSVQIKWRQLKMEFGSSQGTLTYYLPPEGVRNCRGAQNTSLELVGAGSYQLTVPTNLFPSGPLSINVSVSLVCVQLSSGYCPRCYRWRYTGHQRSNLDIPAKRGIEPCTHMHCILY